MTKFIITFQNIQTICNENGKKILEYSNDTLLSNIPDDQIKEIAKYADFPRFAIGKYKTEYPGYRKISINEFQSNAFQKMFCVYYWNNGSFSSLENHNIGNFKYRLLIDYHYLKIINDFQYVIFDKDTNTFNFDDDLHVSHLTSISKHLYFEYSKPKKVELFIADIDY
jgi:hypothetical protein